MIKETIGISLCLKFENKKNLWDKTDGSRVALFEYDNVTETYYGNVSQFTLMSNEETFSIKSIDERNDSKKFLERYQITSMKVKVMTQYTNILNVNGIILNNKSYFLESSSENNNEKSCNLLDAISLPNIVDFTKVVKVIIESQTNSNFQDSFGQFKVLDKLEDLNIILIQLSGVIKKQIIDENYNQINLDTYISINDMRGLVTIGTSVCKIKKIHIANTFFFEEYKKPVKVKTYRLSKGKLFDMKIKDNYSLVCSVVPLISFKKGIITTYKFKNESEKLYNFFFTCTSETRRILPFRNSPYIYVVKNKLFDNDIQKFVSFYSIPILF